VVVEAVPAAEPGASVRTDALVPEAVGSWSTGGLSVSTGMGVVGSNGVVRGATAVSLSGAGVSSSGVVSASRGSFGGDTGVGSRSGGAGPSLSVTGALDLNGRRLTRLVSCRWSGNVTLPSGPQWHAWAQGDCEDGLPTGACVGQRSMASACGPDSDWRVLSPGDGLESLEVGASAGAEAATSVRFVNGGMSWENGAVCSPNRAALGAVYWCAD
jgi:hypothetical protein